MTEIAWFQLHFFIHLSHRSTYSIMNDTITLSPRPLYWGPFGGVAWGGGGGVAFGGSAVDIDKNNLREVILNKLCT